MMLDSFYVRKLRITYIARLQKNSFLVQNKFLAKVIVKTCLSVVLSLSMFHILSNLVASCPLSMVNKNQGMNLCFSALVESMFWLHRYRSLQAVAWGFRQ